MYEKQSNDPSAAAKTDASIFPYTRSRTAACSILNRFRAYISRRVVPVVFIPNILVMAFLFSRICVIATHSVVAPLNIRQQKLKFNSVELEYNWII